MEKIYTTPFQFERLKKQVELYEKRLIESEKSIGEATEFGDLIENAEFQYANESATLNMARLSQLRKLMGELEVLTDINCGGLKQTKIGSSIEVLNLSTNQRENFNLVGEGPDIDSGEVSYLSPLGRGMIGHFIGDIIEIPVPSGNKRYRLLSIWRYTPKNEFF